MMDEARGVWLSLWLDADGHEHSYTLRQEDGQADDAWLERIDGFCSMLRSRGYTAAPNGRSNSAPERTPSGETRSIEVSSITLAAGGDNPRWVVKGGNLSKFGVTCWPEVLEAAGLLQHLDPIKTNTPQARWLAYYTERTNDEGRQVPDKIIRLERIK